MNRTDGALVNLNYGTHNFRRYDRTNCRPTSGWDNAWNHDPNAPEDAQYIGVCFP